ncbi:hypothetical protein [Luteolibacter sp. LG18]|uniref:DUF6916 family protein n=1 Tax=Luteolibacter sp. LG18 TaxID=2819286 RepID=UPI0030C72D05
MPDQLSRAWFLPHLKSRFSMSLTGNSTVDMTLVEVGAESTLVNGADKYTAFSILFRAPQGSPSEDGTYHIRHQELGEMELFLTPVGRYTDHVRYEAAFTRKV